MTPLARHDVPAPPAMVARRAAGRADCAVVAWEAAALDHRVENMTTRSLIRYQGTLDDGGSWSAIAKTLRPAWTSPQWSTIPPAFQDQVREDLDWLDEPRLYECGLRDTMPDGLRMPELYEVERGDEWITLWLEDVDDVGPWDAQRYRSAARHLGRMTGQFDAATCADRFGLRLRPIERLFYGKVTHLDLRIQAEDGFWAQDHVAAAVASDHRTALDACAARMPDLLARTVLVPYGVCHGDATPGNFLAPAGGGLVAIDWSYGHCGPVGSDLGQLLVGRFESGDAREDQVDATAEAIVRGFMAGLDDAGSVVDEDQVRTAWACHLAVRSVFSALVVDHRPDLAGEALADLTARRAAVARFGMALVESVLA